MTARKRDLADLHVVVAALTYRRPDDLAELLPVLTAQARAARPHVEILIVDNDPGASAQAFVSGYGQGVRYEHAAEPGIAAARNYAIEAAGAADLLIFIDDDERPVEGWLDLLLGTWAEHRSEAVVGPVVSEYVTEPDEWVKAGRFFERRRLATGTETDIAATNNLLLDLSFVNRERLRFDARFGLSGGSDTLFTRQLHSLGGRLIWCDEAVVVDVVPPDRVTRQWVLRRAFRSGNSWMRTSLALESSPLARLRVRVALSARGLLRIAAGATMAALGVLLRRMSLRARGLRTAARGAGVLAGSVNSVYVEYRRAA